MFAKVWYKFWYQDWDSQGLYCIIDVKTGVLNKNFWIIDQNIPSRNQWLSQELKVEILVLLKGLEFEKSWYQFCYREWDSKSLKTFNLNVLTLILIWANTFFFPTGILRPYNDKTRDIRWNKAFAQGSSWGRSPRKLPRMWMFYRNRSGVGDWFDQIRMFVALLAQILELSESWDFQKGPSKIPKVLGEGKGGGEWGVGPCWEESGIQVTFLFWWASLLTFLPRLV